MYESDCDVQYYVKHWQENMMNVGTRTLIFGTVRRISSIGLGGKANCGIKTMSEVNSLILS